MEPTNEATTEGNGTLKQAITLTQLSVNPFTGEPANVVDGLFAIATALHRIADLMRPEMEQVDPTEEPGTPTG